MCGLNIEIFDRLKFEGDIYIVLFQKISMLPPEKGLEFPRGWGFCKAKKFKEMYEA